jgi:hypothetical protein
MKMGKVCYIEKNFQALSELIIRQANAIIHEYRLDGYRLTLRQLYYQFVARDLFPEAWIDPVTKTKNHQRNYKKLGSIISDGRLAGLIDWTAIVDKTRVFKRNSHWETPGEIIAATVSNFQMDYWEGQEYRPEVWIEKQALEGVISGICSELDVRYFSCKGYVSQSKMWSAAQRIRREDDQKSIIIHLGDHDPSGIDMSRDIEDRMDVFGASTRLERIALNMDQVEQYDPPPNPAKLSDTRATRYIGEYGNESWELDALEPSVLSDLIREKVLSYRDEEIYQDVVDQEMEYKAKLEHIAENWESI